MKRPPKSTVLPLALVCYLALMAYIGLPEFYAGHYLYYFGIIAATLVCIVALHFSLKRRERLRRERLDDQGTDRSNR